MNVIVLATRNKGKLAELSAMLRDFGVEVKSLADYPHIGEIEETGTTFEENSLLKAREVSRRLGLVAVADDSGLAADALDGAPGVYSARYSGPGATDARNNEKLLAELADVPDARRTARFVCVMTAYAPNGATLVSRGEWEGSIARAPAGEGGFGYDPLFVDARTGRTAAQLAPAEKNAVSHRGRALREMVARWPEFWSKISE